MNMESAILQTISGQLKTLIRLVAVTHLGGETVQQKIITLGGIGLEPAEIADLIGTTRNTVSVTLSRHRKRQPKK